MFNTRIKFKPIIKDDASNRQSSVKGSILNSQIAKGELYNKTTGGKGFKTLAENAKLQDNEFQMMRVY